EPVSPYTYSGSPMASIQSPSSEINPPHQTRAKFRCRSVAIIMSPWNISSQRLKESRRTPRGNEDKREARYALPMLPECSVVCFVHLRTAVVHRLRHGPVHFVEYGEEDHPDAEGEPRDDDDDNRRTESEHLHRDTAERETERLCHPRNRGESAED